MPSPTDSTCPTSATSASLPKPAISCFRIAEISAARISIVILSIASSPRQAGGPGERSTLGAPDPAFAGMTASYHLPDTLHRQPQALQPAVQRCVDHPRADLDDH